MEKFNNFLDMVVSMSVDCRMGGITPETYLMNLKIALLLMEKEIEISATDD